MQQTDDFAVQLSCECSASFTAAERGTGPEQRDVILRFHDFMCFCPNHASSVASPVRPYGYQNNISDNFLQREYINI